MQSVHQNFRRPECFAQSIIHQPHRCNRYRPCPSFAERKGRWGIESRIGYADDTVLIGRHHGISTRRRIKHGTIGSKMCHAPAELYNIERRGYLRPGYQADLVLVNPDHEWTVTADCVLSKCGWSPMEGQKFHSRVEKTFVNGDLVYSDNKVDESHRGQELRFKDDCRLQDSRSQRIY